MTPRPKAPPNTLYDRLEAARQCARSLGGTEQDVRRAAASERGRRIETPVAEKQNRRIWRPENHPEFWRKAGNTWRWVPSGADE